ncbi:MAG: UDP-N-acetyl-D-glucosamine 2-epimerase, UDP-hydrolysing [Candidatus Roizmanbacteria bacterium GW2011_GWC2_37_13]|uniref:UDP-N-acetyl-D-glucosamine 2-epimerase, UDP-hydrolysing n=1 Tax=Candidatus Roizmanbacteria bacterium GW2011_GWC2_37_13 TaxID=1618486 RepID=A0A0G0IRC1_9BACT|nr:MAG: UDP-N-acetyl-D-glucosamine 2-epimerase, UDP-hydrolysing [Candidatus Roizmanbacteria bacterium GW2011_GWC1_37_12]KKQ26709.1 MAG: UDP-N-acetyl-D-glucosamine 2-epimerase, UDP-hydrolysing [Candidatus Roizmanbacteria bacterium GW2011_GWC2_37_13]
MKKKIAYISGGRMDFGLMTSVLDHIIKSKFLDLQLYYTGLHLMEKHGKSENLIKKQYPFAKTISASFDKSGSNSMNLFLKDFTENLVKVFLKNKPDIVIVLGDRIEMLATAMVALYFKIPIAHIHGGDKTRHIDEVARHAITKLSHLHFVATDDAADRVKRMGEEDWRIFNVGAPGLDNILSEKTMDRDRLMKFLRLNNSDKYLLVWQHPVFEEIKNVSDQIKETVAAVKYFKTPVVFIYPNADPGSKEIIKTIDKEKKNPFFRIFPNVDRETFISLERHALVWVTNSSAGVIESASFHKPVVNLGKRQEGRIKAENVIDVDFKRKEIIKVIEKCQSNKVFLEKIKKIKNPWGDGKAGFRISNVLERIRLDEKLWNKQISY